jgi:uncharacterized membrane protein
VRLSRVLIFLAVVVVVAAAVASGVTYVLVRHNAPAHKAAVPPVAFTGVLRDTSGKPAAHVWLQLTAIDTGTDVKAGVAIPVHQFAGGYTDAAGRFTLRQSVSDPFLRKLAAQNSGWVNFEMDFPNNHMDMPWGAPRKISHGAWLADDNPDLSAALKRERLTLTPFVGAVDVLFCATASMPDCSANATKAQEQSLGPTLRQLPQVERVWFVSKRHALRIEKWSPGLAKADQWVVTTTSVADQSAVGKAICAAHYPGVESCRRGATHGGVRWDTPTA